MKTNQLRIALVFIWLGFVCAISFMEAWLKFTAPGVTLLTGLSIGRVVFNALNKVEIVLSALILLTILLEGWSGIKNMLLLIAVFILLTQTFALLPQLSQRISIYLSGGTLPPSNLHTLYVGAEVLKVIILLSFGLQQLKQISKANP